MLACPECKSTELTKYGKKWVGRNGSRSLKQQYICSKCGRKTVNPVDVQPPPHAITSPIKFNDTRRGRILRDDKERL